MIVKPYVSPYQVGDALIRANKDSDAAVFPGGDHGASESPYGQRRRAGFFVWNLLGVELGGMQAAERQA